MRVNKSNYIVIHCSYLICCCVGFFMQNNGQKKILFLIVQIITILAENDIFAFISKSIEKKSSISSTSLPFSSACLQYVSFVFEVLDHGSCCIYYNSSISGQ